MAGITDSPPEYYTRSGLIYVLEAAGMLKIGWTAEATPDRRVADLQTGCPVPLRVLATCRGSQRQEALLHVQFGELRSHGEWFRDADEIRVWIEDGMPLPDERPRKQSSGNTVVQPVRVSKDELELWGAAATLAGSTRNGWARKVLRAAAEEQVAESRRAADEVARRDRLKAAMRG